MTERKEVDMTEQDIRDAAKIMIENALKCFIDQGQFDVRLMSKSDLASRLEAQGETCYLVACAYQVAMTYDGTVLFFQPLTGVTEPTEDT